MEVQENLEDEKISFMSKLTNPFHPKQFFKAAEKLPRLYLGLSVTLAIIGFGLLLVFPFLLLTLPFEIYSGIFEAISQDATLQTWIDLGIQLALLVVSGLFTWALFKIKFTEPTGVEVTEKSFPLLHKIIASTQEEYACDKIHRVILRDHYEVRVVKTPVFGLPFKTRNTLVIGLPVLLSQSPLYFRVVLARRIGQLSAKHTMFSTWLFFLVDYWKQLRTATGQSSNLFTRMLGWLLKVYVPVFNAFLKPLMQQEELEADSYSMDVVNNQDLVEAIVYEEVVMRFLESKYWPKIHQMARRTKQPEFLPYAQMTKVVKNGITSEELSQTIQQALTEEVDSIGAIPSLSKRLNHMGHTHPSAPKKMQKSAAESLLGQNLDKVIQLFDKRWLKRFVASRKSAG